jgi:hypothetical protein
MKHVSTIKYVSYITVITSLFLGCPDKLNSNQNYVGNFDEEFSMHQNYEADSMYIDYDPGM